MAGSKPLISIARDAAHGAPRRPAAGPLAAESIFVESWWLDAVCPGAWRTVCDERGGRRFGSLSFACYRRDGVAWCGLPPLTRLAYPLVDPPDAKDQTIGRTRLQIESALIARLPPAGVYEFVLPPDTGNALAWQTLGFDARVQHTFRIAAGTPEAAMWQRLNSKTRNLIRRAQDALELRDLDDAELASSYHRHLGAAVSGSEVARVGRVAAAVLARGRGRAVGAVDGQGRLHAVALFVWDASDYYYFLSTRDVPIAALGAVDYLVWSGMCDAMQRGLRFDFDGVSSASRLHFLQSFGGELASRLVVTRWSASYHARRWLRSLRRRWRAGGVAEEFP